MDISGKVIKRYWLGSEKKLKFLPYLSEVPGLILRIAFPNISYLKGFKKQSEIIFMGVLTLCLH